MTDTPRIMLAAPMSGAGKTTVTLALLAALQSEGIKAASFKCGPDYIDPMFHQKVLGIPSFNLDLFLSSTEIAKGLLSSHANGYDIAVIEGVMGYYDGVDYTERAGSYDMALISDTPVALVLPARGAALSLAAMARGFGNFRQPSRIAGLILNECNAKLYERLKAVIEAESGLPLLGYLPRLDECVIESRHLGLVTPAEIDGLQRKLERMGKTARTSLDIGALMQLARGAPPLEGKLPEIKALTDKKPRIAVAYDKAFCFYYADNLAILEKLGAKPVFFSPLADTALPPNISALYIGGGYPELYMAQLSA
ncbi:MAG: cobyrinate a,c-diamide synthase, partial [Clostridiales bacterium]|nr:cobyrinate a,c-diamide synthase [Clostridiales bacterium]